MRRVRLSANEELSNFLLLLNQYPRQDMEGLWPSNITALNSEESVQSGWNQYKVAETSTKWLGPVQSALRVKPKILGSS